jgi:hypothetical protein
MALKSLALGLCLAALPALAFAAGCSDRQHKQTMTCAAGTSYDAESGACLPTTS